MTLKETLKANGLLDDNPYSIIEYTGKVTVILDLDLTLHQALEYAEKVRKLGLECVFTDPDIVDIRRAK